MADHFYGHLDRALSARFLAEARRVAERVLVIEAAWRVDVQPEEVQERVLLDGSRHMDLGGAHVVPAGGWFVAVMASRD